LAGCAHSPIAFFLLSSSATSSCDRGLTNYRRRYIGFVLQFYNLVPMPTAYENVVPVAQVAERPMRPDEALSLVGLESRMYNFPAQLSGGEQQRVAIVRAIVKRPCAPRRGYRRAGFKNGNPGHRRAARHKSRARNDDSDHHLQCDGSKAFISC
jgi:hypothetical protein